MWDLPGVAAHIRLELPQGRTVHLELMDSAWALGPLEVLRSFPH